MKTDIYRDGYCICCPKCGKVLSRSFRMDSVIVCGRCGFRSHASVKSGTVLISDAGYIPDEHREDSGKAEDRHTESSN